MDYKQPLPVLAHLLGNALRHDLSVRGLLEKAEGDVAETGGDVIIARDGELVILDSGCSVIEPVDPWAAIGSGADFASAYLWSTAGKPNIQKRAEMAINCAIALDPGCGGPAYVAWTKQDGPAPTNEAP